MPSSTRLIWPIATGILVGAAAGLFEFAVEIARVQGDMGIFVAIYALLALSLGVSTVGVALIVAAIRREWSGGPLRALAFGMCLVTATGASWATAVTFRVGCPELQAEGERVAAAIEQYQRQAGAYPESLSQVGIDTPPTRYGSWSYGRRDSGYWLGVGDYGRDGLELSFSTEHGWYCDT